MAFHYDVLHPLYSGCTINFQAFICKHNFKILTIKSVLGVYCLDIPRYFTDIIMNIAMEAETSSR